MTFSAASLTRPSEIRLAAFWTGLSLRSPVRFSCIEGPPKGLPSVSGPGLLQQRRGRSFIGAVSLADYTAERENKSLIRGYALEARVAGDLVDPRPREPGDLHDPGLADPRRACLANRFVALDGRLLERL